MGRSTALAVTVTVSVTVAAPACVFWDMGSWSGGYADGGSSGTGDASNASDANPCAAHGGTTYYVSLSGDDRNGAGTQVAPFRTLAHGASVLNPGDTLCVRAGTYPEQLTLARSGAPGAPIVLSGYPGERPVIDPAGAGLGIWSSADPIAWIEIRGFEIRRGTGGIYFRHASNSIIADNWIHDNGNLGTAAIAQGIFATGHDVVIERNVIHDNGVPPYNANTNDGMHLTGRRYTIVNNLIYGNESHGLEIAAYACGSSCPESDFSGAVDWTVANNVFAFEKVRPGVVVWLPDPAEGDGKDLRNLSFANNVFFENNANNTGGTGNGVALSDGSSGGLPGVDWTSVVVANNLLYSSTGVFGIDTSRPITVHDNVEGKPPLFVDATNHDFHLQVGSPAIGAGKNLTSLGVPQLGTDFDGHPRPASGAWAIGAYEHL